MELADSALNPKARVIGTGIVQLPSDSTRVTITVIAEDGTTKSYYITINKTEDPSTVDPGDGDFNVDDLEGLLTVSYTKPLTVQNIIPGWTGSHEFILTNHSTRTIVYDVNLINIINDFTSDNFVYSLVKDGQTIVNETPALKADGTIADDLIIGPGETARFSINYRFIEIGQPQDYDQGRNYRGTVQIIAYSAY